MQAGRVAANKLELLVMFRIVAVAAVLLSAVAARAQVGPLPAASVVTAGGCGSATAVPVLTLLASGQVSGCTPTTITPAGIGALALAGGTLTGGLTGTTATFSGTVIAPIFQSAASGPLNLQLIAAGTGNVQLKTTNGAAFQAFDGGGTAAQWVTVTPGTTGNYAQLSAGGTDTNRSLHFTQAGTGVFEFVTGQLQTTGSLLVQRNTVAWSGASASTFMGITSTANATGSIASGVTAQNLISMASDTLDISAQPTQTFDTLRVQHNFGGTGTKGARTGITSAVTQTAATDDHVGGHLAFASVITSQANDGGSSGTYRGGYWSQDDIIHLSGASTYNSQMIGIEMDMAADAGSSVQDKIGFAAYSHTTDAVQGSRIDTAFNVGQAPTSYGNTSPGWLNGLLIGTHDGQFPLDNNNGAVISIQPSVDWANSVAPTSAFKPIAALAGIDLSYLETTKFGIAVPGVAIDGNGAIDVGSGKVSFGSTGLSIDTPNYVVTGATVYSGQPGMACFVGDKLYGPNRGIYTVSTVNGSNQVTGVTIDYGDEVASSGAEPANPVAMVAQNCHAISLNLTWGNPNTLSLNPSGGALKVGAGAFTANGTTAATLTSLAPSGAHATVQEWFTVTDSGGTVRYIPAF